MLPVFLLMVAGVLWQGGAGDKGVLKPLMLRSSVALAIIIAVAGRWYWHVRVVTGSWSGQGDDAALHKISIAQKLAAVAHVDWRSGAISVLLSHIWFGGWSFLRFPPKFYVILSLPIALAVIGVAVRWNRSRTSSLPETNLRQITILAIAYLCFWIGVGYHVLVTFMNQGVSASTGWYLYCLVAAEVVLLIWGLEVITSKYFF